MSIIVPFADVKRHALLALYRLVYASNDQQYFTKRDVAEESGAAVGAVFFGRVLEVLVNEDAVFLHIDDDGNASYTLTNAGWETAEQIALASLRNDGDPTEGVPASDRVVSLSDNQRSQILNDVDELTVIITASNEVSVALGENKDRMVAELNAGRELAAARRVRLGAIIAVLATPLRFLISKFSGDAVGEVAKKLLDLLWNMMSS